MKGVSQVSERVLLVDDDRDVLDLLGIWLEADGYVVDKAENGDQALEQLSVDNTDVVITDLAMPGMDGLALLDRITNLYPRLPVIMISGRAQINDALAATNRGVASFLTKPVQESALSESVNNALRIGVLEPTNDADMGDAAKAILHRSSIMRSLLQQVRRVGAGRSTVMIFGETGSGKELLAQALHEASPRSDQPFIAVNCAALPEQLLESELFGHVKGAFTGAMTASEGLFRAADGGTLFLDEVGDMPLALQVRLLRVLQESVVRPVGSTKDIPINVRVVTATHRDLDEMLAEGAFREDLYYRLNVIPLHLPALKERREDILLLVEHFLGDLAEETGEKKRKFSPEAADMLLRSNWPGNVRQLANVVEQCAVLSNSNVIPVCMVENALKRDKGQMQTLEEAVKEFERGYMVRLLRMVQGNVTKAANIAGRNRTDFYNLLNRHNLDAKKFRHE